MYKVFNSLLDACLGTIMLLYNTHAPHWTRGSWQCDHYLTTIFAKPVFAKNGIFCFMSVDGPAVYTCKSMGKVWCAIIWGKWQHLLWMVAIFVLIFDSVFFEWMHIAPGHVTCLQIIITCVTFLFEPQCHSNSDWKIIGSNVKSY